MNVGKVLGRKDPLNASDTINDVEKIPSGRIGVVDKLGEGEAAEIMTAKIELVADCDVGAGRGNEGMRIVHGNEELIVETTR